MLRVWWSRIAGMFGRREDAADFHEELHAHLDSLIEENLRRGMTREEALRRAHVTLGGVTQLHETQRAQHGLPILETVAQDVRYAARTLRKSPGFTLVAVLSLALGIGANTAMFSMVDAVMLRALPVAEPERLVAFGYSDSLLRERNEDFSYAWFQQLRAGPASAALADIAAVKEIWRSNVTIDEGPRAAEAGDVMVGMVSGGYFTTLGVDAVMGRALNQGDEDAAERNPVAVISHRFWRRWAGAGTETVGRTVTLNGTRFTIVGVMPSTFTGDWVGRPTDLWVPVTMEPQVTPERPDSLTNPNTTWLRIIARRKPGVTLEQAEAAAQIGWRQSLQALKAAGVTPSRLEQFSRSSFALQPFANGYAPERQAFGGALEVLVIVASLVLLIACANIASLLLARSTVRQQEIATRVALGAARARIVRQLLTESLLLALVGGLLGLAVAERATAILVRMMTALPQSGSLGALALAPDVRPDARVLALTASLTMLTALAFGLLPALRASKVSISSAFAARGVDAGRSPREVGMGRFLVVAQIATALLLLVCAGLFVRTLRNLKSQDLGLDPEHVLLAWTMPGQSGRTGPQLADYYQMAQERMAALPGVRSASASMNGLLNGAPPTVRVRVPGLAVDDSESPHFDLVAPGFFTTVGMRLLAGRDFTARDSETAPHVAILNQYTARLYFGEQNPIGKTLGTAMMGREAPFAGTEVVGVVSDTKGNLPLRASDRRMIYFPYRQDLSLRTHPRLGRMCLAVRTTGDPQALKAELRAELRRMDPGLPVIRIDSVEEQLDESVTIERLIATLSGWFGAVAAALACLGLYGLLSYAVARRRNEIGVRLALGATPAQIRHLVLRESSWLVLLGMMIGVPATFAATRLIASRLFGVGANDPFTMVGTLLLLAAVCGLASVAPAHRAARVDPMVALRYE